MPDLGSQLRAYYDRLMRPTDPEDVIAGRTKGNTMPLDTRPTPAARWWRRPAVALTSAALATVLLIGGGAVLLLGGGGGGDIAVDPTASSTTLASTTIEPATTTAPATSAPATTMEATTTIPATSTTTQDALGFPASLDMHWERLPDDAAFDNAWITAVTAGGPGLVAVGYIVEEPWPAEPGSTGPPGE